MPDDFSALPLEVQRITRRKNLWRMLRIVADRSVAVVRQVLRDDRERVYLVMLDVPLKPGYYTPGTISVRYEDMDSLTDNQCVALAQAYIETVHIFRAMMS